MLVAIASILLLSVSQPGASLVVQTPSKANASVAKGTPGGVVSNFLKACDKCDFNSMAGLLVDGKTDFDYSKLAEYDPQLNKRPLKLKFAVKAIKVNGDKADVTFFSNYNEENTDHLAKLTLVNGDWKIVSIDSPALERLVKKLIHPAEELAEAEKSEGPTTNRTAETMRLGKARTDFFLKILAVPDREPYGIPYNGYSSMMMVNHTTLIWQVGRVDEVLLSLSLDRGECLTRWKLVSGKPKRMWQFTTSGVHAKPGTLKGTLAMWLNEKLPAKIPTDMRKLLGQVHTYATYTESIAMGRYFCATIAEDGTVKKTIPVGGDIEPLMQDSWLADHHGFFITPAELAALRAIR